MEGGFAHNLNPGMAGVGTYRSDGDEVRSLYDSNWHQAAAMRSARTCADSGCVAVAVFKGGISC